MGPGPLGIELAILKNRRQGNGRRAKVVSDTARPLRRFNMNAGKVT